MALANTHATRDAVLVRLTLAAMLTLGFVLMGVSSAGASGPTCSDSELGDWANHGQHITEDYVFAGEEPGARGAPGVHQHADGALQPGASFCVDGANSPTGNDFPGKGTGSQN